MFKIVVFLFALFSSSAHAENWYTVTDSSDGLRLIADLDTVIVDKYNTKDGKESVRIRSVMQFVGNDTPPFTSIIDVNECFDKKRGVLVTVFADKTSKVYFWDGNGSKMYDAQGQFLCGFAIGIRDQSTKQSPNNKPTSSTF